MRSEDSEADESECASDAAEEAWARELRRRREVNLRLAEIGSAAAVMPSRPTHRDALRYVSEALRRGNDALETELCGLEDELRGGCARGLCADRSRGVRRCH